MLKEAEHRVGGERDGVLLHAVGDDSALPEGPVPLLAVHQPEEGLLGQDRVHGDVLADSRQGGGHQGRQPHRPRAVRPPEG